MTKDDFKTDLLGTVIKLTTENDGNDFPFGSSVDTIEGLSLDCVYDESKGDGNECVRVTAVYVDNELIGHVRTVGTYSSWDNTTWYPEEITLVHSKMTVVDVWMNADGSEDHKHTFIK
jgi:hypothetical protein